MKQGTAEFILTVTLALLITVCGILISTDKAWADTATMATFNESEFEQYLSSQGFPESYKTELRSLHALHPSWVFIGQKTGLSWNDVLSKEADFNVSLVNIGQPDSYKSVASGNYNFSTHTYIGKDSSSWVSASNDAVKYFLDPRNFLKEKNIFMFEDQSYHPEYQTESIVSRILSGTSLPESAAAYFLEAARQEYNGRIYSVSPVHLASRVRQEVGAGTFVISGEMFSYGGLNYMSLFNPYNIGATSGGDAAKKALIYANGGTMGTILSTTYNRPWNTLRGGIMGGALFLCDGYINNSQNTIYLEKFNVANGLESVAVHQYMTNIMAPYSESSTVYNNYSSYGILDESLTFLIPIFDNMPEEPYSRPAQTGNNNYYLDSLGVEGYSLTRSFGRFVKDYTVEGEVPAAVSSVTITAAANADDAAVSGTGTINLAYGENKKAVTVTSSSGKVRTYTVTINREIPVSYSPEAPQNFATKLAGYHKVQASWDEVSGAEGYTVYYKKKGGSVWYEIDTPDNTVTKLMKSKGSRYDLKVRAYVTINGQRHYSSDSNGKYIYTLRQTDITLTKVSAKSVRVKFDNISGETGYKIYRATSRTGKYKLVKTVSKSWKSWLDLGKTPGKTYYYKVRAYRDTGEMEVHAPYSEIKKIKL